MNFPENLVEAHALHAQFTITLTHLTASTRSLRELVNPLSDERELEGAIRRMGEAAMLIRAHLSDLSDHIEALEA